MRGGSLTFGTNIANTCTFSSYSDQNIDFCHCQYMADLSVVKEA